ncbi:hypothetical protein AB8880_00945 [Alphaproteobacteria bacterium LSUCC0684]
MVSIYLVIRQRLLTLSVTFLSLYCLCLEASASTFPDEGIWKRLFLERPATMPLDGKVFAVNLNPSFTSIVVSFEGSSPIFMVPGDRYVLSGRELILSSVSDEKVIFEDADGLSFVLFLSEVAKDKSQVSQAPLSPGAAQGIGFLGVQRQKAASNLMPQKGPMYGLTNVPTDQVEQLAAEAGIPEQFIHLVAGNVEPARSRGGRPGWKVNAAPPLLKKFGINLHRGDIILAVDGIPSQRLEEIQKHITKRQKGQIFQVEVQRDNRLIMLEFSE